MSFGDKLKDLRVKSGMSQEQLAQKLGITRRSIVYYETSERYPKKREILLGIAKVVRARHLEKADVEISLSSSGNVIDWRSSHSEKVKGAILRTFADITTDLRFVHPVNALISTVQTESGITIDLRLEQFANE